MKTLINIQLLSLTLLIACSPSSNDKAEAQSSEVKPIETYIEENDLEKYATAVFAGGCFWCTEASFERIKGVRDVVSGYAGGEKEHPTYGEVSSGQTRHAESIYVFYDSTLIDYGTLLSIFFTAHDPTQVDRQGPDIGPQYRSAIFYQSEKQRKMATDRIDELNRRDRFKEPIATELSPYDQFWMAEEYHQNYYVNHPDDRYIQNVSKPKVEKVEKKFRNLLKADFK